VFKTLLNRFGGGKKKKEQIIRQQTDFDKKLVFSLSKSRWPTLEQLKYLPKYLGRRERWILVGLFFSLSASVLFLAVRFYLANVEATPDFGGEYVEGLAGGPEYVNPILAQTNDADMDLSRLIFSGLFKYNAKQELVPDLVDKFEMGEDKRSYTFRLKDNVYWHDGEKLKASDVAFTISSIQDTLFKSPLYSSFRGIEVEEIDERTVRFKLKEPYGPFLGMLTFGILPEHLWYNVPPQSANLAEYNIKPVGSGPFKFKSLTKDKSGNIKVYTLVRNENFYGQKSFLEKLVFKFYSDFPSAIDALQNKNIEGISFLPKEFRDSLKSKRLEKYFLNLSQYTAIFLNQKNNELLKDKAVREALARAIDKNKIIQDVLGQEGEAIDSPNLSGYVGYSTGIKKNDFNPTLAAELLDKAGFKFDGGSVRKKGDQVLKITLTTIDRQENIAAAETIKNDWESLGVQVELRIVSSASAQREIIRPRAYEALLYGVIIGFDPDPFPFWHSSQTGDPGLNLALYANRKVDKLLEEARQTDNLEERAKKYIEFQNILAEDVPAIFLYSPRYTYVVDREVRGIEILRINIPSDRFAGIENWYKETKRKWR